MKWTFMIISVFFSTSILLGQSPLDNIWILAHSGDGGTIIDFSSGTAEIYGIDVEMHHYSANASICDTLGNLLFYTNGTYIADATHQTMENSLLDCGELTGNFPYGVNTPQIVLILPRPGKSNLYFVFNKALVGTFSPWTSKFYYSIIDMEENNGLGGIIEKNHLVIEDVYLGWGKLTACKHANGRDWWILLGEGNSNSFFSYLLTPEGLVEAGQQNIGGIVLSGLGQAVFSPDGTKYATVNIINYDVGNFIDIYDFDRCDGTLSNHVQISYADSAFAGGVAFSPNSRFLYVSSTNYVYQFDVQANDILGSKDTVAVYDGFQNPLWTSFYLSQLAPDGKIYISAPNGTDILHVINQPNEKGIACDLVQHSVQLPTYNAFSIPNFPNFNLGTLEGSPCDTLGVTPTREKSEAVARLYPNPAAEEITVEVPAQAALVLYDALGRAVLSRSLLPGTNALRLDDLPPGLYFYEVKDGERLLGSGKLVRAE